MFRIQLKNYTDTTYSYIITAFQCLWMQDFYRADKNIEEEIHVTSGLYLKLLYSIERNVTNFSYEDSFLYYQFVA